MALNLLVLGPQGAGKGTQAKRIAGAYGIPHVATGDMLREMKEEPTELGRELKAIVDDGALVPDDFMIQLIRERLSRDDTRDGFILDGFPRTIAQAEALDELLRDLGRELDCVLGLEVDDETATQRLTRRAQIEGRADDTPEGIRRRLATYHEQTEPLVEYYRSRDKLAPIDGDRNEGDVFRQIEQALGQVEARAEA